VEPSAVDLVRLKPPAPMMSIRVVVFAGAPEVTASQPARFRARD